MFRGMEEQQKKIKRTGEKKSQTLIFFQKKRNEKRKNFLIFRKEFGSRLGLQIWFCIIF